MPQLKPASALTLLRTFLWSSLGLLCWLQCGYSLHASEKLHPPKTDTSIHFFLDNNANLSIEDLKDDPQYITFLLAKSHLLTVGFSRYPLWLRMDLSADNPHNQLKINSFLLEQIDLYQVMDQTDSTDKQIQHTQIRTPQLFSNNLMITSAVKSTIWVRITSKSAIDLAISLGIDSHGPHASQTNLKLLAFAIALSLGLVGVILHTQNKQQRLGLLSLQSLLLLLSGFNLQIISSFHPSQNILTTSLLLTFLLYTIHFAKEQPWWSKRHIRHLILVVLLLLLANLSSISSLTFTLLVLLSVLSHSIWKALFYFPSNRNTFKISFRLISTDVMLWIVYTILLCLHTGYWPYPTLGEMVWSIGIIGLSILVVILQLRDFLLENHPTPSLLSNKNSDAIQQHRIFQSFAPQPTITSSALQPKMLSGMRHEDSDELLHDHLSVIQHASSSFFSTTKTLSTSTFPTSTQTNLFDTSNVSLISKAFNLRILAHELLQQLESLTYAQGTPLLFAIKPGTHTHLVGAADAFMILLQQLTQHSLQLCCRDKNNSKSPDTICIRIEDEELTPIGYPIGTHSVVLRCNLRDSSCLNIEELEVINQRLTDISNSQLQQLQQNYPYLIAIKQLIEPLHGQLKIRSEGSATTCYSIHLTMQCLETRQPDPPKSFLTLKDKKILLMTYDGEYGMTMTEQASSQDIPLSLALSINQARRNLQNNHKTDSQFDLLVLDCSQAEETIQAFLSEVHSSMPGYANTLLLLLYSIDKSLPIDNRFKYASKPSAFVQLGALMVSLFNKPASSSQRFLTD